MILERGPSTRSLLQWSLTHKLGACALVAAFAALCLAAADALLLAARAMAVALGFVAAVARCAAYRNLARQAQRRVLSQDTIARDLRVSAVLGVALAFTSWFAGWIPLRWTPDSVEWLWPALDFLPSVFALLVPSGWQSGVHRYFNDATYCFPGPFWTAIPAYAFTFLALMPLARLARSTFSPRP